MDADSSTTDTTQGVQDILPQLKAASLAVSSRTVYDRTWQQWCQWRSIGNRPVRLPRESESQSHELVEFAIACWTGAAGTGTNSPATVLSKISHLGWHPLQRYGYSVQLHAAHLLAMRGMRQLSPPSSQKPPIIIEILRQLRRALDFRQAHHRVIWGATVMGYYFLLRRSEYLAVDGKTSSFIIQRCDILFTDNSGARATNRDAAANVTVTFEGSKTDQFGESTTRTLSRSGSPWLCPLRATWALVAEGTIAGRPEASPLCALPDGSTLTAGEVTRWIKIAARLCGQDETRYSTHSLRSGGAAALFSAGSADTRIKLHGRWRSDCFQRYVHIDNASTANIARTMTYGTQITSSM
ncbi:hypothetical protein ON010_g4399 [Phytophthora cinnamomi]|nr:hypothetical protein ON010_g4399 [Phytophthora cinnamomi]